LDLLTKITYSTNESVILFGFLLGVAGSLHCVGMCGAIAGQFSHKKSQAIAYHFGKTMMYGLFGYSIGLVGQKLNELIKHPIFTLGPAILVGVVFILLGLKVGRFYKRKAEGVIANKLSRVFKPLYQLSYEKLSGEARAFGLGTASAFLPCGLLYSALFTFTTFHSPIIGSLGMISFGLGTIPALIVGPNIIRKFIKPYFDSRPNLASASLIGLGLLTISYRMVIYYGNQVCH
jgi:sulfite exporter TauE/SafE